MLDLLTVAHFTVQEKIQEYANLNTTLNQQRNEDHDEGADHCRKRGVDVLLEMTSIACRKSALGS